MTTTKPATSPEALHEERLALRRRLAEIDAALGPEAPTGDSPAAGPGPVEALLRSERRCRSLIEGGWDVITLSDAFGQVELIAGRALGALGYAPEQLVGRNYVELVHPDDVAGALALQARLLAAPHEPVTIEARMRKGDGGWVWMEMVCVNHLDDPAVGAIVTNTRDISRRKEAERALAASEERLRVLNAELERRVSERTAELADLYDRAPCGYHSMGADGTYRRVNDTELAWLGYTRAELVGQKSFSDLLTPASRASLARRRPELWFHGQVSDLELTLVRKDGTTMPVSVNAGAVKDASGTPVEARVTMIDITARKHGEDSLRRRSDELSLANAALTGASRAKDEFLASMSHELRTPLNAVLGLCEALEEQVYGPVEERQRTALRRIEESGRRLLALIDDILDLSKLDADRMPLDVEPVRVDEICKVSLRSIQEPALRKQQTVGFHATDGFATLPADARRLKQILVNLLSNAVKFTPEGGSVGLDAVVDEAGECVRFTVWDTGKGIADVDLPRLFRPFAQLDGSLSREHGGTGLGLSLVRKLVELHGGGVSVESEPGKGSRFEVILPRRRSGADAGPRSERGGPRSERGGPRSERPFPASERPLPASGWPEPRSERPFPASERPLPASGWPEPRSERPAPRSERPTPHSGWPPPGSDWPPPGSERPRALVVEDSPPVAEQLGRYLVDAGVEAILHEEPHGVVERVVAEHPQVVLLDILLPAEVGWDILRDLKADPRTANVPVVVVSVLDRPEQARALGADACLVKPVTREQIQEVVDRVTADAEPGHPLMVIDPPRETIPPKSARILVAESNEVNAAAVLESLRAAGYEIVVVARNGREAVERARELRPDLILMNVSLPGTDGVAAIREIRTDTGPSLRATPIIAVTALAMRGEMERCLDAGASAFLTRPIRPERLTAVVDGLLGR
jgi:PAS domain S-box-containing protein